MEGKSLIKVFKTHSFLIVEYTVQFMPWTKTKFSNLSVSDVAKISKTFFPVYMGVEVQLEFIKNLIVFHVTVYVDALDLLINQWRHYSPSCLPKFTGKILTYMGKINLARQISLFPLQKRRSDS
jgi:hypothetical protein